MMKNNKFLFLLITVLMILISCNKPIENVTEKLVPQNFNFKNLQENFSLYKTRSIYKDTSTIKKTLFYKDHKELPNNAFLVVQNKCNDTILKYFDDYKKLSRCYVFRKGGNYFIHFNTSPSQNPTPFNLSKLFKIDTVKQTFVDVLKDLSQEPFQKLFLEKLKDSVKFNLLYKRTPPNNFLIIGEYYKDSLDFYIKYESTANLEFIEYNDSIQLITNPIKIKRSLVNNDYYFSGKVKLNNLIGEINGHEIVYDCYGCYNSQTDNITIYAKKDSIKTKLFTYNGFGGNYLDEISIRYFDKHPFLYIHSTHTYGHSRGDLYALDIKNMKSNYVNIIEHNINIPDSLHIRNSHWGVSINDKDDFQFGYNFSGEKRKRSYNIYGNYQLLKVKNNIYILDPINVELNLKEY